MRAGRLSRYVRVESRTTGQTAGGSMQVTWTPFAEVYARIRPMSGNEAIAAGAERNGASHLITIRYLQGLTAEMRIVDVTEGTIYSLVSPPHNPDMKNIEMELNAMVGLKDG